MLEFLRAVCRKCGKLVVVCECSTGMEAVQNVPTSHADIILLDLSLPDIDGFQVISRLRASGSFPKVIAISSHIGPYIVYKVESLGLNGYLDKMNATLGSLTAALEAVLAGGRFLSAAYREAKASVRSDNWAMERLLSPKQIEILSLVSKFEDDAAIAQQLSIAPRTVETHRTTMMRKLNLHTRVDLIHFAKTQGCI